MRDFDPRDKIESARMDLVLGFPFFGSVFLRLNVFEDASCKTAWTDGISLGYNVNYTASLEHFQIIGLFVHEVLHVMLKHHIRAAADPAFKANHHRYNCACDYALNPTIKRTKGMDIHRDWLYKKEWDDSLAEHIFYLLKDENLPPAGSWMLPGEVRPLPRADGKPGLPGQAEIDQASNTVDQWVRSAAFKAQGAGKMDGGTKALIRTATASAVDWTEELIFLMQDLARNNYCFTKPNVRYMDNQVFMPSIAGTRTSDLLFFVDTSGSLSESQLKMIMAEIRSIITDFDIRVVVIYWDTAYRGHEIFDATDVLDPSWEMRTQGRGGTRFGSCWDWMEDNLWDLDVDPKGIVFFSDLECRQYPDSDPGLPLLWCQTPDGYGRFEHSYISSLPTYGKRVLIPVQKGE